MRGPDDAFEDQSGFPHSWEVKDSSLDFVEADPKATHLHLAVIATQVVQRSVGAPIPLVAGAVHPLTGTGWIFHERLLRLPRCVQVAASHANPGHADLADGASR